MSYPALTTLVGFAANPKTAIDSIDWTSLSKVEADGVKSYLRALHSADRGRTRERERTEPGLSEFTLDNRDRRFEPEYAETGGLDLPGTSGHHASTPDASHLDIAGDIDIRVKVAMDDWTPAAINDLVSKWPGSGNTRSYLFRVQTDGDLELFFSDDGINSLSGRSTVATGVADGAVKWVRATLDIDDGAGNRVITFYTSSDGVTWTQLGSTVTQVGALSGLFNNAEVLSVGARSNGTTSPAAGIVYYAEIRSGIGGNIVASPDFTKQPTGTTSLSDAQGNVWTVNGANSKVTLAAAYSPNVLPGKPVRHGLGYMPLVISTKPIAYWRFGEAAGATTALDEMTVNPFNLTKNGSPTFGVTGKIPGNTAVEFANNTADHLSSTAFTPALTSAFTIAAWVKTDMLDSTQRNIFSKATNNTTTRDIILYLSTGNNFSVLFNDAADVAHSIAATITEAVGTWYFVVATWDGVFLRIYIDGVLETTSADLSTTPPRDSVNTIRWGRGGGTTHPWDGLIDEGAIWDRALSDAEITALYNEGAKNIQDGWIWHGYMEGWPPSYPANGKDAVTNAVATDAIAVLALDDIDTPYVDAVLRRSPNGFWRLTGSGETPDASGNNRPGLLSPDASFIEREGSYSENAVFIEPPVVGGRALNAGSVSFPSDASIVGIGPFTILIWINHITTPGSPFGLGTGSWFTQGDYATSGIVIEQSASSLFCRTREGGLTSQVVGSLGNDRFYFVAFVREVDGTLRVYLDGTLHATTLTPTQRSLVAGTLTARLGGAGPIAEPAVIPSALTASQISAIYVNRSGWANDKTGARIGRVLDAISWPSGDRDIDAGRSSIQEQDQQTNALAHVLDMAEWDSGYFFPKKAGDLRFDDRHARLTSPLSASQATFAWAPVGAERGIRGVGADHHWRNVKNYIRVERINGNTAIAQDAASIDSYGRRVETRTTKVVLDLEALSDAEWTLLRKKDPRYELESLEIYPGSDDELWTQVITREIGDRITLIFRPPGGGTELSRDFHIEHVHHECTTPITKDWLTRWRLSAADTNSYFEWDVSEWDNDAAWAH